MPALARFDNGISAATEVSAIAPAPGVRHKTAPPGDRTRVSAPHEHELRRHWPIILACFCIAVFAWGYGFYGHAVYLAELRTARGWPASVITAATTTMYLGGAALMPFIHGAMTRFGPRAVLGGGFLLLGCGAIGFANAAEPWQLFLAALPMAAGWASTTGTAIATTMGFWFDRRRPLALSLALNGASASGFIVAPLLVQLSQAHGVATAVLWSVLAFWALLLPILMLCVGHPPVRARPAAGAVAPTLDPRPGFETKARALRSRHFWSVALPFALALSAQVGFIVHLVSFLLPALGPAGTSAAVSLASVAAMAGRIGAGLVIDRLPQRPFSALSFLVQAVGLGLMFLWPGDAVALFAGCLLFGASVGNVITLPAIVIQREFAAQAYGMLVGLNGAIGQFTLAIGPILFGLMRDLGGSYAPVLLLCMALQVTGAALVARPRQG